MALGPLQEDPFGSFDAFWRRKGKGKKKKEVFQNDPPPGRLLKEGDERRSDRRPAMGPSQTWLTNSKPSKLS